MIKYSEPFTYETAHLFYEYDKETGEVYHKKRTPDMYQASYNPRQQCSIFNRKYAGKPVGCAVRSTYVSKGGFSRKWRAKNFQFVDPRTGKMGSKTTVHRLVWLMEHGFWPKQPIDHINGDPLDNRIENLRMVDHTSNSRNAAMNRRNTSGYTGVVRTKYGKYHAYITIAGKYVFLGSFTKIEDAAEARRLANKQYGFHPDHGKRVAPDHGVRINDKSSTAPSVRSGGDSSPEPVQGELSFL